MDERYADAVNEALDRLAGYGPEWGRHRLAFHAPMAAEALAALGYHDQVVPWIEHNRTVREYSAAPQPHERLDPEDAAQWRAARGDFGRFADWARMFDQELASRPWREVLVRWWPRLAPGMLGALGHGLIRTAHAVRGIAAVPEPTPAQLRELAQGLAFWAARYWSPSQPGAGSPLAAAVAAQPSPEQARTALVAATATAAGVLADRAPMPTVPLIHMVTIPAAVDLTLAVLPVELHQESYRWAVTTSAAVLDSFGAHLQSGPVLPAGAEVPSLEQSVAAAVETGDEHAIKIAEVCVRSVQANPDEQPYRRAVATVIHRLVAGQATQGLF